MTQTLAHATKHAHDSGTLTHRPARFAMAITDLSPIFQHYDITDWDSSGDSHSGTARCDRPRSGRETDQAGFYGGRPKRRRGRREL
ncbi:hypothetical protein BDI4_20155 [Burkholderia diffusa]|nr:hypothetical protein BDI4_20155 [Burkholderia diffusa]